MKSLNVSNPILFIPASNFENQEFKMQDKMQKLIHINLGKIARKMEGEKKGIVIMNNYDLMIFTK